MQAARITIFAGHYGSGKTNLAINYAIRLRAHRPRVTLCDLDIVNPYFRAADARAALDAADVPLISPRFANTNVEAPAMPVDTQALLDDSTRAGVIDLGGDDRGSLALGRYAGRLRAQGDYAMLLVINPYRPLTRTIEDLQAIREEIESAARLPFTAIVNNPNLGAQTVLRDVIDAMPYAMQAQQALGLPLLMTAVDARLVPAPADESYAAYAADADRAKWFPITLYEKTIWRL